MQLTTTTLDALRENTWNPNQQDAEAFAAEIESIKRFGFIDPITVRVHPDDKDAYEIIDGAHRYRALTEIGHDGDVPVVVIDVTTEEAQTLTIVLNETRGAPDKNDLASLLSKLNAADDDLLAVLPYTQEHFDELLALADIDFAPGGAGDSPRLDETDEKNFVTMTFTFPADDEPTVREALATAQSVMGEVDGHVNGHALVAICAHHLTGA